MIDESSNQSKQEFRIKDFKKEDLVSIVDLEKRPDLHGRQVFIAKPVDAEASERLTVELFPTLTGFETKETDSITVSTPPLCRCNRYEYRY